LQLLNIAEQKRIRLVRLKILGSLFYFLDAVRSVKRGNKEVMLTSYDSFRIDIEEINQIDWACAFFDEAHKIKCKGDGRESMRGQEGAEA
jgi:SNF2 family DNA or RNA helicase